MEKLKKPEPICCNQRMLLWDNECFGPDKDITIEFWYRCEKCSKFQMWYLYHADRDDQYAVKQRELTYEEWKKLFP